MDNVDYSAQEFEAYADSSFGIDIRCYMNQMQTYKAGIKEIRTKLEILDEEFQTKFSYNPIHHIESRLKSFKSIAAKAKEKGISLTIPNMRNSITDIAGIRVICNYIDDIYRVEELLLKQNDVTLLRRRDYIKKPKASGYQSLHLLVEIPVFLSDGGVPVPVEIQIRTIAMDFWASLEHKLKYKADSEVDEDLRYRLKICAVAIQELDNEMQEINNCIRSRREADADRFSRA
ncbi:GTP pyrophosphokinase family protein [Ruminococcus sp. Marseille-P6503]|uniref:GTP pyrophosphokinase n=1 Tax=Ruminococcus sp. Marseille-P6503 TaxID=2364796 RepID=UPI000F529C11|nr:GTP pyrophosphokinase family protein [Ruminococcus sp. Marseille-P6503]